MLFASEFSTFYLAININKVPFMYDLKCSALFWIHIIEFYFNILFRYVFKIYTIARIVFCKDLCIQNTAIFFRKNRQPITIN